MARPAYSSGPWPDDDGPWTVYHRPKKGRGYRWRAVATVPTFREAVALANGPGDWWYSNRPDPDPDPREEPDR